MYTVDLRQELQEGNRSIFSRKLQELMADRLNKGQQTILFLNRRGYAGFVSFLSCRGQVSVRTVMSLSRNIREEG